MEKKGLLVLIPLATFGVTNASNFTHDYNIYLQKNIYNTEPLEDMIQIPQGADALIDKATKDSCRSFKQFYDLYFRPWKEKNSFDRGELEKIFQNFPVYFLENYQKMTKKYLMKCMIMLI